MGYLYKPGLRTHAEITPKQLALAKIFVTNEIQNLGYSFREMIVRAGYEDHAPNGRRALEAKGTQTAIAAIRKDMASALAEKGVDSLVVAEKIRQLLDGKFEKGHNYKAVDRGVEHALKIGIGGGYAPERKVEAHVHMSTEDVKKFLPLKNEFEEKLRLAELGESNVELDGEEEGKK